MEPKITFLKSLKYYEQSDDCQRWGLGRMGGRGDGSKSTKSSYKINRSWGYKISVQVSQVSCSVVSDSLPPLRLPVPPPRLPPLSSASFPPPIFAPHCPSLATNRSRPLHFLSTSPLPFSVSHSYLHTQKPTSVGVPTPTCCTPRSPSP